MNKIQVNVPMQVKHAHRKNPYYKTNTYIFFLSEFNKLKKLNLNTSETIIYYVYILLLT